MESTLPRRFMLTAAILAVLGMCFGIWMGINGEATFNYAPVHAHINLVGWVSMFLFGLWYRAHPAAAAGTLAQVHFKVNPVGNAFILPVSAIIFRNEGLRVGVVKNGAAQLVPVTIGQDDGRTVQVITGISKDDQIIQDPPDSLIDGEKVHVLSEQEIKTAQGGK